ncbi:MAG: methionyl-tRNA formyltransferase [bacterium]|nr:MAG: methionyl-tRNA formyltransferase [bacterium]
MMRILFMGSPDLAIPSFRAAAQTGHLVGVVTQPPRASGRGQKMTPSPISVEARKRGMEAMTPESLRSPDIEDSLRRLEPDIVVVVAYGKILPPNILALPRLGCVNIHASILPRLRGAAPIQWAIALGYTETGVTLMQMDEGMDTGPILLQRTTPVEDEETAGELGKRLALIGADLLREGLPRLGRGELTPIEQDDSLATYAPLLKKADGLIDWSLPATQIANRVRGFSPWPGTFTTRSGSRLLITRARSLQKDHSLPPGSVVLTGAAGIQVACTDGTLEILAVKPEGKREMAAEEFLSGYKVKEGEVLGK